MKALVFNRPKTVAVEKVTDPKIKHPQDAILKVTSTAICGSDLHIYNGFLPQVKKMVLGHEFMGIVEEVGEGVKNLKKGDRVVVPCPIACGSCYFCKNSLPTHCEHSNENYGPEGGLLKQKGAGLFGYTDLYGGHSGGQAEYVRVPYAHYGPRKVADQLKDEEVLFLTDAFPTGWAAIDWANLKGGETVVVFGCGPVGIMAQKAAWLKGAGRVIAVDLLDYRLEIARKSGKAETINLEKTNPVSAIREMTGGRGADVCVDAAGMEGSTAIVDKLSNIVSAQKSEITVLESCISSVRRGGHVSVVGIYGVPYDNFPMGQIFDKGISLKFGQAPVHRYIDELMNLVKNKKVVLDDIITHTLPLDEAPRAYEMFSDKKDNCLKIVLKP